MKYTDMMKHKIWLILSVVWFVQTPIIAQYQERVYLQTDKQLYLSGELLWLKLYTTNEEGELLSLSKIGYVELIHDSIPEIQIKIDIRDGTGAGWMELPAMLPTGYYRMIAYTRYMRNEGEPAFFEKLIAIVNPFHQDNELYADETNTPFTFQPIAKNNTGLEISTDKPLYTTRDNGTIRIKGLPVENISLGISIAGIDPVLVTDMANEETGINGWKNQLSGESTSLSNQRLLPEYEGAIIDGVLIDLETGNPADTPNEANLLSFPGQEIQLFAGQTDKQGNVTFYTQCVTGKQELTTTAIASSGKKYRIDILSPYAAHAPKPLPLFKPDSTWLNYLQQRNLAVQVTHAFLADSLSIIQKITPCTNYRPYSRYELDEYTRFPNMEEVFIEFITFAGIRRTNEGRRFSMINESFNGYTSNVLVLLDNIPVADHELMSKYNPLLIKTIELHIGRYIFSSVLFEGIIAFYSYKNDYPGITFSENTQIYDYEGAQPYRYFYSPDYSESSAYSRMPDFRHTLLWEPSTQSYGRDELTIPFTTSDIPGRYVITVEGIGEKGTRIRAIHSFEVNTP